MLLAQVLPEILRKNYNGAIMHIAKPGEMAAFFIDSHFQLILKAGLRIQLNCHPTLKNNLFFVQ